MSKRIYLTFLLTVTLLSVLACVVTPLPTVTDAPIIAESYRYQQWMNAPAPEVVRTGAGKMQRWEMP